MQRPLGSTHCGSPPPPHPHPASGTPPPGVLLSRCTPPLPDLGVRPLLGSGLPLLGIPASLTPDPQVRPWAQDGEQNYVRLTPYSVDPTAARPGPLWPRPPPGQLCPCTRCQGPQPEPVFSVDPVGPAHPLRSQWRELKEASAIARSPPRAASAPRLKAPSQPPPSPLFWAAPSRVMWPGTWKEAHPARDLARAALSRPAGLCCPGLRWAVLTRPAGAVLS